MSGRFFNPRVGSEYDKGICGKKILVLGASFYCNKDGKKGRPKCEFFDDCTSAEKKDSSSYNETCPYYAKIEGHPKLSDEPENALDDCIKTYKVFAKFMYQFIEDKDAYKGYDEYVVWERMAFTDYVQFFLPTKDTYPCYLSQRDFDAFIDTLIELKPDVVIAWGLPVTLEIRDNPEHKNLFTDLDKLSETEHYVCHMKIPGVDHIIAYVNCYHPSSMSYWYNNIDALTTYMHVVLESK